ncbi:cytochrome c [Paracoccus sp. (in: a-proteobacteria)]|uniref:cytochrome c n=1 Tax=Paracoccus sp. TaxID=267 RepID=UPI00321F95B0
MRREDEPLTPVERAVRKRRLVVWLIVLVLLAFLSWRLVGVNQYVVAQDSEQKHFLHGSIGAETANGLPYWVFKALPVIYRDRLGDEGWGHFGLITPEGDDLPLGFSRRVVTGVERVWFNCSLCHVGSYRLPGDASQHLIAGAPANNLRLQELILFLTDVGEDPGFTADALMAGIDKAGGNLSWPQRLIYRHLVFPRVKTRLQWVAGRLAFVRDQVDWGPGRVDTFNPYKAIQFNFPMDEAHVGRMALNGASDYPAIWQQAPRDGMNLHWDGNNDSVAERNLSAALGAGVTPVTVDRAAIARIEGWMWHLPAPRFPGPVDDGKARAGATLYARYCAACHGALADPPPLLPRREYAGATEAAAHGGARDCAAPQPVAERPARNTPEADDAPPLYGEGIFAYVPAREYDYSRARHPCLGEVEALMRIGTDPGRWLSYTREFAAAQNLLYAGYPWRFHRFHKTEGYASQPLDGIWARSPYLHNGSVPTLRDLLEPAARRPAQFRRGSDELDLARVGYRSDAAAPGRTVVFDTALPGNGNAGHEYGTHLTGDQKDAIVEYMKKL